MPERSPPPFLMFKELVDASLNVRIGPVDRFKTTSRYSVDCEGSFVSCTVIYTCKSYGVWVGPSD